MRTRLLLRTGCVLAAIALTGCASALAQFSGERFHGTVVDSETREPIEGAVITIIWWKEPFYAMHGGDTFLRARETSTDEKGRFSIPAARPLVLNPLHVPIDVPTFIAYAPGYYPFPKEKADPELTGWGNLKVRLREGLEIPLVRIATLAERRGYVSFGTNLGGIGIDSCPGDRSCVPFAKIPLLVRAAEKAKLVLPKDNRK